MGLYLAPPQNAIVLCVDEKSQIQALDRTAPMLPMSESKIAHRTHNYRRHGITTLFAALEIATHPQIIVHFTPTSGSWLNLVEVWFAIIDKQAIRRGIFTSVRDFSIKRDDYPVTWLSCLLEVFFQHYGRSQSRSVRKYHRSIQIQDALATLQAYSRATDDLVQGPESIAQSIRDAVTRRKEQRFKERGQDWSAWARDEDQLALVGEYFRDRSKSMQSIARAVSTIFQPAITVPLGVSLIGFVCGGWAWAGIALLLTAGLPVGMVLVLRATHVLESMRIPRRSSRLILLSIMVLMEIAVIAVYGAIDAPDLLIQAQVALLTGLIAVVMLTTLLRVSVHCAAIAVIAVTLTGIGGTWYGALLLLVPLVGWSRIEVREHTRWQVIIGSTVPILPTALALTLWG